jgi:hypothetical protein
MNIHNAGTFRAGLIPEGLAAVSSTGMEKWGNVFALHPCLDGDGAAGERKPHGGGLGISDLLRRPSLATSLPRSRMQCVVCPELTLPAWHAVADLREKVPSRLAMERRVAGSRRGARPRASGSEGMTFNNPPRQSTGTPAQTSKPATRSPRRGAPHPRFEPGSLMMGEYSKCHHLRSTHEELDGSIR